MAAEQRLPAQRLSALAAVACVGLLATGCIEPFPGSHLHLAMGTQVTTPCQAIAKYNLTLGSKKCSTKADAVERLKEDRFTYHYEIWATMKKSAIARLAVFTVQGHLFWEEQKAMEKRGVIRADGKPFKIGFDRFFDDLSPAEQKEHTARGALASTKLSVTSFSPTMYESDGITLTANTYIGNAYQLTRPHNGVYYGQVEGYHPFGPSVISGGNIKVLPVLDDLDSIWITIEGGDPDRANPKPSKLIYLQGAAYKYARGVINVDAISPLDPSVRATFSVISDLAEEEYF